jgi:type II secretory pathway component PulF
MKKWIKRVSKVADEWNNLVEPIFLLSLQVLIIVIILVSFLVLIATLMGWLS